MSTVKWSSLNENKVNLKKKTYPELQELLERQDKILSNRYLIIKIKIFELSQLRLIWIKILSNIIL